MARDQGPDDPVEGVPAQLHGSKLLYSVYLLLGLILCMGVAGVAWSPDGEFFPFASFSLFSVVPNVRTAYDIEIYDFHDRPFNPPVPWEQAEALGIERTSSEAFYAIQRLGKAYAEGQSEEADNWRHLLEKDFLSPPVRYDLVRVRYDPFEWVNMGRLMEVQTLASYVADD